MHGTCPCCCRETLPHADECTWEQDAPQDAAAWAARVVAMQPSQVVADARAWLAERGEQAPTHSERCHTYHLECLVVRLLEEIERLQSVTA